jgi:transposase
VSADIKVRFGGARTTAQRKAVQQLPVINALTSTPSNRDVRVHDNQGIEKNIYNYFKRINSKTNKTQKDQQALFKILLEQYLENVKLFPTFR